MLKKCSAGAVEADAENSSVAMCFNFSLDYTWDDEQRKPLAIELEERRQANGISLDIWQSELLVEDNEGHKLDLRYTMFPIQFPIKVRFGQDGGRYTEELESEQKFNRADIEQIESDQMGKRQVKNEKDGGTTDLANEEAEETSELWWMSLQQGSSGGAVDADLNRDHFHNHVVFEPIRGQFKKIRKLADAIYGQVFLYQWLHDGRVENVVIKQMSRESVENAALARQEDPMNEIGALQFLASRLDIETSGQFVVKTLGCFVDDLSVWLLTEPCGGLESFNHVVAKQSEQGVIEVHKVRFMWQLLQALCYLHSHNVGHRDVSLENILLKDGDHLRLMDFGQACPLRRETGEVLMYRTQCGKHYYRPPEVYDAPYAVVPVDLFSAGIVLFILHSQSPPWTKAHKSEELFKFVASHGFKTLLEAWHKPLLSPAGMEVLSGLAHPDADLRISMLDCLNHAWFEPMRARALAQAKRTAGAFAAPVPSSDCGGPIPVDLRVTAKGKQLTSQCMEVPPTHWGIAKNQIRAFLDWCKQHAEWFDAMNARDLVERIIKPIYTSGRSVAVECNNDFPMPVQYMISHCWDENITDFLNDILSIPWGGNSSLFICFFSVFQGTAEEIDLQVTQGSTDINSGCFAQTIAFVASQRQAAGFGMMYVVPNDQLKANGQGLYSRLWCSWEVYNCVQKNVPINLWPPEKATHEHLFGNVDQASFSVQHGHCGPPAHWGNKDEQDIKVAVESHGGWHDIDEVIKKVSFWGVANVGIYH